MAVNNAIRVFGAKSGSSAGPHTIAASGTLSAEIEIKCNGTLIGFTCDVLDTSTGAEASLSVIKARMSAPDQTPLIDEERMLGAIATRFRDWNPGAIPMRLTVETNDKIAVTFTEVSGSTNVLLDFVAHVYVGDLRETSR